MYEIPTAQHLRHFAELCISYNNHSNNNIANLQFTFVVDYVSTVAALLLVLCAQLESDSGSCFEYSADEFLVVTFCFLRFYTLHKVY